MLSKINVGDFDTIYIKVLGISGGGTVVKVLLYKSEGR
jgi:hypothetical protein